MNEPSSNNSAQPSPNSIVTSSRPLSLSDRVRSLRLPTQQAAPRKTPWLPWSLCVLLAGVSVFLLLNRPATKEQDQDQNTTPSTIGKGGDQGDVNPGDVVLESKGYIYATHLFKVGPNQVGSKVVELHESFLEGNRIRKGALLARLDETEYKTRFEQAKADYDYAEAELEASRQRLLVLSRGARDEEKKQSQAELSENKTMLKKMELDLDRHNDLKTGRAVAKRDYDEAKFSFLAQRQRVAQLEQKHKLVMLGPRVEMVDEGRANVNVAKAKRDRAKAIMMEAKWRLDNCKIFAPITGIILKKNVELYDPLDARGFNQASMVCEMADLTELEVELSIQEREIAKIELDMKCLVRPETHPHKTYKGIVSRKMPQADRSKGAVPVRVRVLDIPRSEEGVYLVPEGGATVTFLAKDKSKDKKKR